MIENENDIINGEMLTYNQIKDVLGGNYGTIRKLVDVFVEKNNITIGQVFRQNRSYKAFLLTNTNLAELQLLLKGVKATVTDTKTINKSGETANNTKEKGTYKQLCENENINVTNYEAKEIIAISQKNSELEKRVVFLEATLKDKEIEKEKIKSEKEKINSEKVMIEADLYKAKSDLLYITDKQKSIENDYFEQKQQNEILIKENKKQTNIINVLAGLLIVLITILATAYIVMAIK